MIRGYLDYLDSMPVVCMHGTASGLLPLLWLGRCGPGGSDPVNEKVSVRPPLTRVAALPIIVTPVRGDRNLPLSLVDGALGSLHTYVRSM